MERIQDHRPAGIGENALRMWGFLFLALGTLGRGLLQTHVLGLGGAGMQQMLDTMNSSSTAMALATASLMLQAIETCAAPIFAFLLVDFMVRKETGLKGLLSLLGLALVSEIPYNLAMGGKLLDISGRNPVFSLVLGMILILFYQQYAGSKLSKVLIRIVVTLAGVLWGQMLRIDHGGAMVVIVAALWIMRDRPNFRNFVGMAAAMLGTLFSPFYLASPMGFLAVHMYNGEEQELDSTKALAAYPVLLLIVGVAGIFLG